MKLSGKSLALLDGWDWEKVKERIKRTFASDATALSAMIARLYPAR